VQYVLLHRFIDNKLFDYSKIFRVFVMANSYGFVGPMFFNVATKFSDSFVHIFSEVEIVELS